MSGPWWPPSAAETWSAGAVGARLARRGEAEAPADQAVVATDIYATYYAALPLLCAALLHERVAASRPQARPVLVGALAVGALLLAVHAYVGLYRDNNTEVRTARGTYVASDRAGPEIQRTVDLLRSSSRGDDRLLALPDDPGLHFMSGLEPALYELTFLPGTLDTQADERAAIRRMERLRPRFMVIGARRFDQYGLPEIGADYNRLLLQFVRARYPVQATFGDFTHPPRNSMPSEAFEVRRRPD